MALLSFFSLTISFLFFTESNVLTFILQFLGLMSEETSLM